MEESVWIEHWYFLLSISCSNHSWCTSHNEEKYASYFEQVKEQISSLYPNLTVHQNSEPPIFKKLTKERASFPRIGSFEVYFKGKVIFSKLELGKWPNASLVAQKIKEASSGGVSLPPIENKPQTSPRAFQRPKKPISKRKISPPAKKKTKRRAREKAEPVRIRTPELAENYDLEDDLPRSPLNLSEEEKPEALEKVEEKSEEEAEEEEDEPSIEGRLIEISIPLGETKQKVNTIQKLPLKNEKEIEVLYTLEVSDSEILELKESNILLEPNSEGKIEIRFISQEEPSIKEPFLIIKESLEVIEEIKFKITYTDN